MTTEYVKVDAANSQVKELADKIGADARLVAAEINKQAYRKAYAQRDDVKAKRAEYTRARNEQLKTVAQLLKLAQKEVR